MEIRNSYGPNFYGYKSVFSKRLEKALLTRRTTRQSASRLLDDFAEMYGQKVCSNSKMGSGFYGSVYRIDDCYVLKRGNEYLEPEFGRIELVRKRKFGYLKHYFGEAIAKIYNNIGEDMAILKNVYSKGKSIPVGVPVEFSKTHTKEECYEYYSKIYLPKFAKLPQRSFDGIAKDFAQLNKMCTKNKSYFFDFLNPNNFVLCGKTLRILDDVNEYEKHTRNCVSDMLRVFLNKLDFENDSVFEDELLSLRKELTKKLILAGVKYDVPMCYNDSDLVTWSKTFNDVLGMNEIDVGVMTCDIDKIVLSHDKPKQRVEIAKQYLEEFVGL